ncbi:DinB family protein [Limnoglobus roseus]|uniref:DinB family protein n=1 Tax=Limnoglobus roseus TaxID=2598579 RepID=A0A5C1A6Z2_9BACT|nr:DinB family protein [Limnoglobus roseus]QEL13602.1 DinB family protein [Limnoglobus roseus]
MLISELMVPELAAEMAMTRKLLARIPDDKLGWKPADGLHTIGWNASHLADIAGWVPLIVTGDGIDLAPVDGPAYVTPEATDTKQLLVIFDENVAKSLAALAGVPDAIMDEPWSLKMGGQALFTIKKGECLRKWVFSHTSHHRGILSVYLKMVGVPFSSIFEE